MPKPNVLDLYQQLADAQKKQAEAEADIKKVKAQLAQLIAPNTAVSGIKHLMVERPSISYKAAVEQIIDKLVPKTKHDQAKTIINLNTSVVAASRFMLANES